MIAFLNWRLWLRAVFFKWVLVDCSLCGGAGFVGYGDICGHCGGQLKELVEVLRLWPFPKTKPIGALP